MHLRIVTIGTKMPGWVVDGCNEYSKRLPRELKLQWIELPLGHRNKNAATQRAIASENDAMLAQIPDANTVVALDQRGKSWSTEQLAAELRDWQMNGRDVSLLIGGPDGLGKACVDRADKRWSLSELTLPHPLVRVLLVEQLYRAWSLNQGHPYHR